MLKLSYRLIKNRKKFVATVIGTISLSALLVILANLTFNSIYVQKKELALKTYGSFICGVNGITEEDAEKIHESDNLYAGFWELYQNVEIGNSIFTIGYGDKAFLQMTNACLEAGRMQDAENEIVLERFIAELYGISDPGESIKLSVDGEVISVKVTGILRNYTNQLSVYYRLEKGINNYPNILCCKENVFNLGNARTSRSVLLGFEHLDDIGINQMSTFNKMFEYLKKLNLSSESVYTNDNLFNRGLMHCGNMKLLCYIFSGLIIIATLICSYGVLKIFYWEYGEKLGILMSCGLQKRKAVCIVALQLLYFTVLSVVISIVGGCVASNYWGGILYNDIQRIGVSESIPFLIIWFCLLYLLLLCIFTLAFRKTCNKSIYRILTEKFFVRATGKAKKPLNYNILRGIRYPRVNSIALYIFLFAVCYIVLNGYYAVRTDYDGLPDYELYSKEMVETEVKNGYVLEYNPDSFISTEAVKDLKHFRKSVFVDAYPNTNSNTLLIDSSNIPPYFEKWISLYALEETSYEESKFKQSWSQQAEEWIPVPNVEFIVADEEMLQVICQKYHLNKVCENMLDGSGAILFLPEAEKSEIGIQTGDTLVLGGFTLNDQRADFDSVEVNIKGIVRSPYKVTLDGYTQEREELTVVVSDRMEEKDSIFKGYKKLVVYAAENMAKQKAEELDNRMNKIQSEIQGGVLYSKQATQEADALYTAYIRSLGAALISIVLLFSSIFVYTQICSEVKENRKKYGILMALGVSVHRLSKNIFMSYLHSLMISFLVDIGIVLLFFRDTVLFPEKILFTAISLLVSLILTVFGWLILFFLLRKEKIRWMME